MSNSIEIDKVFNGNYVNKSFLHSQTKEILGFNLNLEKNCNEKYFLHVMTKKNFFESKNIKELCRKGVPFQYFHTIIRKLFHINKEEHNVENFLFKKEKVFKGFTVDDIGEYIPLFTSDCKFEEIVYDFLNEEGRKSVKIIQWMLNSVIPTIEHSPLIIKINVILHMFCDQYEVYFILKNLINQNYSRKDLYKIRWHMRFQFRDNKKIALSIIESQKYLAGKVINSGINHLESLGFNPVLLVEDMIFNFFFDYFRFEGVYRVFSFFLREGIKAFYRLIYGLFKEINPHIEKITNKHSYIKEIRRICKEIQDYSVVFENAFEYALTRNNNKYVFQEYVDNDETSQIKSNFYIPHFSIFNKVTSILSKKLLLSIWNSLPYSLKIKDCHMIYSTESDGFSLQSIYHSGEKLLSKNCNNEYDYISLVVIETLTNEIFGGVVSRLIYPSPTGKNDSPYHFYLIKVSNNDVLLYNRSENIDGCVFLIENDCFSFGIGRNGLAAFRLDENLCKGFSYESLVFNSPKLVENKDGEYTIKKVEVYILS